MYIIKKLLRDIPSSSFLIIGMALTFFLMLNSVNIISSINYEQEIKEKESYSYEKFYEVIKPNEKATVIENGIQYSSGDFDGKAFLDDVMKICSEYQGNAYLSVPMSTRDNLIHGLKAYLCINEENVISLVDGDRDVITSAKQVKGKCYVPESMISYIENGRVQLNGDNFTVAGVIKDNSVDMSNDEWIIMYEDVSDKFKSTILDEISDLVYSGENGFSICFQSNSSKGAENFKTIEKKLVDNGYIVRDEEEYYNQSIEDVYISEYVIVMQALNVVLEIFALVSCLYVVSLWIDRRIGELMIRKSFGGSTRSILWIITKDLVKLSILSMCIAMCLQIIYRRIFPVNKFMIAIRLEDLLFVVGGMATVVVVVLCVPLVRLTKISPATGIREE